MASDAKEAHSRLRELLPQLHHEALLFNRIMYRNRNQHRRCPYFRRMCEVRRDLHLLQSANLPALLDNTRVFVNPSVAAADPKTHASAAETLKDGAQPWEVLIRSLWGLLGLARLLQQMHEPILKASSQISSLLGQSFFMPFALTVLAILARLRVLILQMNYDVILVFNLLSHGFNCRMASKTLEGGIPELNSKTKRFICVQGFRVEDRLPYWLVCCSQETESILLELESADLSELPEGKNFPSLHWFNDVSTGVKDDLLGEIWVAKNFEMNGQKVRNSKTGGHVSPLDATIRVEDEPCIATESVGSKRKADGSSDTPEAAKRTKRDREQQKLIVKEFNPEEISRKKKELLDFLEKPKLPHGAPDSLQMAGKLNSVAIPNKGIKAKVAYISVGLHNAHTPKPKESLGSNVRNIGAVSNLEIGVVATEGDKTGNIGGGEVKQRTDNLFEMLIGDRNFDSLF